MSIFNVKTEKDITGTVARELRKRAHMTQREFWNSVNVGQSAGCSYELGRAAQILPSVRTLLFARYVAGLPIDASTKDGVRKLRNLAKLQAAAESQGKVPA